MWHLIFITSFFIGRSLCCIECDSRGKSVMNKFHTLIQSQVDEDIDTFTFIKRFTKAAERYVLDYLENEVRILDNYAISDIVSEYKKSIEVIEEADFKEVQFLHLIGLHFQRLQEKLKDIVQGSMKRRCPNKQGADSCGLMVQTYINCKTCMEEKIVCAGGPPKNQEHFDKCSCLCTQNRCFDMKTGLSCSPCRDHTSHTAEAISCGERNIKVTEYEDLILNCNFEWYARLKDTYKNIFTKPGDTEPKVTEDPYLVIKGVQMKDSGMYSCNTMLNSGVPVSYIKYHVTVLRGSETEKDQPRPTLPDVLDITLPETPLLKELEINTGILIAISVAGSVTILLISGICICIFCRKKKPPELLEPV